MRICNASGEKGMGAGEQTILRESFQNRRVKTSEDKKPADPIDSDHPSLIAFARTPASLDIPFPYHKRQANVKLYLPAACQGDCHCGGKERAIPHAGARVIPDEGIHINQFL
jgi:hypothetical protein